MENHKFTDAETLCGFFVSEKRKKIWSVQLDLIDKFAKLCKKYNLRYFASNGTLLGAVRHNGFIPWDDDVDFVMPRNDFEKFTEIALSELSHPYFFQTTLTELGYHRNYARLRNSNTTGITFPDLNKSCNNGIFIDIFPLDGCIETKLSFAVQQLRVILYNKMLRSLCYYSKERTSLKRAFFNFIAKMYSSRTGHKGLFCKMEQLRAQQEYENSQKIYLITHGNNVFVWDKKYFEKIELQEFEHIKIPIPAGYKEILKSLYGNYMELPPIEERGKRHQIAFDPDKPYIEYIGKINEDSFERMVADI